MIKFSTVGRFNTCALSMGTLQSTRCVYKTRIYLRVRGLCQGAFGYRIRHSQSIYFRAGSLNRDATADSTAA